jgi:hypothetical protein
MAVVFHSLRPMLRTKDLPGTLDFYTRRLGFVCESFSAEDGWAFLSRDAVAVMLATPNAHVPFDTPSFTGSLYFTVEDVATLWAELEHVVESPIRWRTSITGCASSPSTTTTATCCSSANRRRIDHPARRRQMTARPGVAFTHSRVRAQRCDRIRRSIPSAGRACPLHSGRISRH